MLDNLNIQIVIIILFVLIILYQLTSGVKEGFLPQIKDLNGEGHSPLPEYELDIDNNKILGYDPAKGLEYRKRKNFYPRGPRPHQLRAHKWETRLPSLVKHRYSYDDKRIDGLGYLSPVRDFVPHNSNQIFDVKGKARLKELPLNLKNRWHAVIDADVARTNLLYWPTTENVTKELARESDSQTKSNYKVFKTLGSIYDYNANIINKINSRRFQPVTGRNPYDSLPAQYADRSKSSIEKLQAADLYKEYDEDVHGWLPYEE